MTTKNYNGVYSVNSSGVVTIVASSGPFHLFLELLTIINFWTALVDLAKHDLHWLILPLLILQSMIFTG